MTSGESLVRGLLEPLLDARRQPATEHFDEVLAGALAAGRVTPELARELRFWQRASVHEVTDHVRTVLPVVLPTALSAVAASGDEADQAAAGAVGAWATRQGAVPAMPDEAAEAAVAADQPGTAQPLEQSVPDASDLSAEDTPEQQGRSTDDEPLTADRDGSDGSGDSNGSDGSGSTAAVTEPPASTSPEPGAAMSPHLRRRLFVAGLTSTA